MRISKKISRVGILASGGLLASLLTGLFIPTHWHGPIIIATLACMSALVILIEYRQSATVRAGVKAARTQHEAMLGKVATLERNAAAQARAQKTIIDTLGALEKQNSSNEGRVRQIAQLIKELNESRSGYRPTYMPLAKRQNISGESAVGRLAAAVTPDLARSEKLLAALSGSVGGPHRLGPARKVGLISSSDLEAFIGEGIETCRYQPSISMTQNLNFDPSSLVIEERAMSVGPWAGALSASGLLLYDEIFQLLDWAKVSGIPAYFLRNAGPADIHSDDVAAQMYCISAESSFEEPWSDGIGFDFLETLRAYCTRPAREEL